MQRSTIYAAAIAALFIVGSGSVREGFAAPTKRNAGTDHSPAGKRPIREAADTTQRTYKHKVLVIDDAFLAEIHNLKRKVNQAVKHPEPVVKLDAPWNQKTDTFNYVNVIYDHQEKLFKMWYVVTGMFPGEYWERGRKTAYATSTDGIHWKKPIMNMVEVNGSKKNNYIIPEMLSLTYTIIQDPSDIPARKYKMIFQVEAAETRWAKFHVPLCLAYSADGIIWDRPTHVNPILRGISDGGWGFFYDPDRRKYILFTRRVPNLPRDISLYESYDLVNWEDKGRILVPGDEYDPSEMFNFQGMTPFFYEDFCLGLLNTQYSLPESESYEVFHKPPDDWPFKKLGTCDVQLAYSRDGRKWSRPRDRSPIIATGKRGSPDAGTIFVPSSSPIVLNGETWIYYTAVRFGHNAYGQFKYLEEHKNDMRNAASCMLARMPEDHWVSLDAGETEGWFLTRVWRLPAQLLINADAEGGSIEAEFITPYGKPVQGLTRKECIPVTGNEKDQQMTWKSGISPASLTRDHRGGLSIKFYLKNAKLYSYTIAEPDPTGRIARYWANARWNEAIMHRSDNWGSASNEPAGGLPQPPGTQNSSGTRFGPNPRRPAVQH